MHYYQNISSNTFIKNRVGTTQTLSDRSKISREKRFSISIKYVKICPNILNLSKYLRKS